MRVQILFAAFLFICAFALPLSAQPRSPEAFVNFGVLRAAGDESSLGTGASFGGSTKFPITRRLAVDVSVVYARTSPDRGSDTFRLRRWLVLPGLMYRWGNAEAYGFIGGGVGAELSRSHLTVRNFLPEFPPSGPGWTPVGQSAFEFRSGTTTEIAYHALTGFVLNPVRQLAIRADLYSAWVNVMPNVGVKLGVGYRF